MRMAAALALLAAPALAEDVPVPSGQRVTLEDVIWGEPGDEGLTVRFRFLAPAIGRGGVGFARASADMQHLCDSYALPRAVTVTGPRPERIIVSLSDVPVPFGEAAPEAVQFIEVYSVAGGRCVWEPW